MAKHGAERTGFWRQAALLTVAGTGVLVLSSILMALGAGLILRMPVRGGFVNRVEADLTPAQEATLEDINTAVAGLATALGDLDADVSGLATAVTGIDVDVGTLSAAVTDLDGDVSALATTVSGLSSGGAGGIDWNDCQVVNTGVSGGTVSNGSCSGSRQLVAFNCLPDRTGNVGGRTMTCELTGVNSWTTTYAFVQAKCCAVN